MIPFIQSFLLGIQLYLRFFFNWMLWITNEPVSLTSVAVCSWLSSLCTDSRFFLFLLRNHSRVERHNTICIFTKLCRKEYNYYCNEIFFNLNIMIADDRPSSNVFNTLQTRNFYLILISYFPVCYSGHKTVSYSVDFQNRTISVNPLD